MSASPLEFAAFEQARRLGHYWVGPEHALLAVVVGPEADVAARALRDSGLEAEAVERELDRMEAADPRAEKPKRDTSPNPAFYRIIGRAEGFAAGLGADELEPVHVLFGMLWDSRFWQFAEVRGIARDEVIAALRRLDAVLPSVALPPLERIPTLTQRVPFADDRLDLVLRLLCERHPPAEDAPEWGFNRDGTGLAWIVAEDGIDLAGIVAEALGGLDGVTIGTPQ